jgi:hypothetical protein
MKTIAFNTEGGNFNLPKPKEDIVKVTGEWVGQPHIIAGLAAWYLAPKVARGKGQIARAAIGGYLGGKYVSETFGLTQSPFSTVPKNSKNYELTREQLADFNPYKEIMV